MTGALPGPAGPMQPSYPPVRDPDRRPGTVLAAGIVTIVSAALAMVFSAVLALLAAAVPQDFSEGFEDVSDIDITSPDGFVNLLVGVGVVFIVWSLGAIVLAVLAMRRSQVARIGLAVSAVLAALAGLVVLPAGIVVMGAATTVVVLLFVGGAGAWYAGADRS